MARKMKAVKPEDVRGYMWNREGTENGVILCEGCYDGFKYKVCWLSDMAVTYPDERGCAYVGKADDGKDVWRIR